MQPPPSGALFLSGKVVLSDGSAPGETVLIQTVCRGQNRTQTHTDGHGNFSFQFGDRLSNLVESGFDAESGSDSSSTANDAKDCELSASLAGFSSDKISLDGRVNGSGSVDLGRIVLHRLENIDGLTTSATTAAAPGPAHKRFTQGQQQEKKRQWEEAEKSFEKAVQLYPKFAAAWCELGILQLGRHDPAAARHSFQQSIAADEKYITPYHGLMRLAANSEDWNALVEVSGKLLALNPINFPDAWYFNGVGHFYLENFAVAEQSAKRGLAIDGTHRVPKLEYLLAMTLAKKNDFTEATSHLQAYLRLVSRPIEIAEARKQLEEIARRSAEQPQTALQSK